MRKPLKRLALIVDCGFGTLEATATSAARLGKCLQKHDFTVRILDGKQATSAGVYAWLRDHTAHLGKENADGDGDGDGGDAFVFAYVGHGVKVRDPAYPGAELGDAPTPADLLLLATHDLLDDRDSRTGGLPGVDLVAWLRPIARRTRNVTVILDCCHSAGLARGGSFADPEIRRAYDEALARAVEDLRARHPTTRSNNESHDPLAEFDRHIVRLVATTQNERAYEGPGLDGDTTKIGLFSDAVATSLERPGAHELTWDDHIVAIRTMVKTRSSNQRPGVEGPRDRFPFSTATRHPTDSATCRPDGSLYQIDAGQIHGVDPGDAFKIVHAADGTVLGDAIAISVAIHDTLVDMSPRPGKVLHRTPESALTPESAAHDLSREPASTTREPSSRLPLQPAFVSREPSSRLPPEPATREPRFRLPLESATAREPASSPDLSRETASSASQEPSSYSRLPPEPDSLANRGPSPRLGVHALRAIPSRRARPIAIAVDPNPSRLAHLDPVRLERIGVVLVRPDRVPADTLELDENSVRLRTSEGRLIHRGPSLIDPAATNPLFHAMWRLAHYRRVLRGIEASTTTPVVAELAWGLAGQPAFTTADIIIPEDSAFWLTVAALSHVELFADVFHLRGDCSIRHLTRELDHGHTVNRSAVAALAATPDGALTPWSLPWPIHAPRDAPVLERLMVVFSLRPRSLHPIAFESTAGTRGDPLEPIRRAAIPPLVKFLEFHLHPRS